MDFERIWLQNADQWSESTWCQHRVDDHDIEYVRVDIAEAAHQRGKVEGLKLAAKLECEYCDGYYPSFNPEAVLYDFEYIHLEQGKVIKVSEGPTLWEKCGASKIRRQLEKESE